MFTVQRAHCTLYSKFPLNVRLSFLHKICNDSVHQRLNWFVSITTLSIYCSMFFMFVHVQLSTLAIVLNHNHNHITLVWCATLFLCKWTCELSLSFRVLMTGASLSLCLSINEKLWIQYAIVNRSVELSSDVQRSMTNIQKMLPIHIFFGKHVSCQRYLVIQSIAFFAG